MALSEHALSFVGKWSPVVFVLSLLPVLSCRADIAVLREKGAWSGSAFSNPGVVEGLSPETKITMRSAAVRIRLSQGKDDTLVAKCEAEFELQNTTTGKSEAEEFLVGFPVTGLNSKIVTITGFTVSVDGRTPPTVLRRGIELSKRSAELRDTPVAGQLEARFQPANRKSADLDGGWGVLYADKMIYTDSYVWAQTTKPGTVAKVKVAYSVELKPQSLRYSKSYARDKTDGDVIPFADLEIDKWDDQYYFFDYVLRSGSTWDGPIGLETIELSLDPGLQLSIGSIRASHRTSLARSVKSWQADRGLLSYSFTMRKGVYIWQIKGKPAGDLLLRIPKSAIDAAAKKDP